MNVMRQWIQLMESIGAHSIREIEFVANRRKAQQYIDTAHNIGDPVDVQVNASIQKIGLMSARVKMTLIGPLKPVDNIASMFARSRLKDFSVRDPDAGSVR